MAALTDARRAFHASVLGSILTVSDGGIASNADKSSRISCRIAAAIIDQIGGARTATKAAGQTAGSDFESLCAVFLGQTFGLLRHLRPGSFSIAKGQAITLFDQYAHLARLEAIAKSSREVATALGADYLIKPDIVIWRHPETDAALNAAGPLVDALSGRHASLRAANNALPSLHASISCKWTLRSDRAQNARAEGLNLIRNRKGRVPHVAVITAEPMPGRLASLALGTGDIDCVYHFALDELRVAVAGHAGEDSVELLTAMVEGRRLRDIADLPLDLAI